MSGRIRAMAFNCCGLNQHTTNDNNRSISAKALAANDKAAVGPQYQRRDEEVGRVPPGSRGLLFLPYLLGERSPHWNPLARAVLEGVAFNLRHIPTSRAAKASIKTPTGSLLTSMNCYDIMVSLP